MGSMPTFGTVLLGWRCAYSAMHWHWLACGLMTQDSCSQDPARHAKQVSRPTRSMEYLQIQYVSWHHDLQSPDGHMDALGADWYNNR